MRKNDGLVKAPECLRREVSVLATKKAGTGSVRNHLEHTREIAI
jgi:hypothetical protein